jgi:CHASE2 domain-containing sensor protein
MKLPSWARSLVRHHAVRFRRFLAILVIVVAVEAVVQIANPFGLEDALKERAAETLQLVTAPFYGGGGETPGQRAVTVVLIDPEYFRAIRPKNAKPIWPMPVDMLTMGVIRRIVDAGPKAVFVDIAFPDAPREIVENGSNSRAEALDALALRLSQLNRDVPVFLGDSITSSSEEDEANLACGLDFVPSGSIRAHNLIAGGLLDGLFRGQATPGAKLEVVDASWRGSATDYQLAPATTGEGNCRGLRQEGKGYIASPALALFAAYARNCPAAARDICDRPAFVRLARSIIVPDTPPSPDGLRSYELHDKATGEMSLRWGIGLSGTMDRFFRNANGTDACFDQFYSGSLDPLKNYLLHLFGPIERRLGKPTHRRCVYIDTISAAALLDNRRFGATGGTADTGPQAIQDAFLKDRIVLLGVNLPQAADKFASPINGAIPGVYLHAAAVENLLTFGDRYHRAEAGIVGWFLMIVVVVILFHAMTWLWEWLCVRLSAVAPGWGMHVLAPLSYLLIMFSLGSLLILLLSYTDLPLTEIAGPVITLHVILFGGMIVNWKDALIRKFAGHPEESA